METYRTRAFVPAMFACLDCGARSSTGHDCACGAGALVDLTTPYFRQLARVCDARLVEGCMRTRRRVAVAVGLFTALAVVLASGMHPLHPTLAVLAALTAGTAAGGLTWKLILRVPVRRRFPELSAPN